METGKIIFAGIVIFGVSYLILRSRNNSGKPSQEQRKYISNKSDQHVDSRSQDHHSSLERVIKEYRREALHYQIFNWRNRKKIVIAAEEALFAKYPKVLGEPVLKLPEELVLNPEVVSDWLANHGKTIGEHEYEGRALADYLLAEANKEAEVIVQRFVDVST